MLNSIVRVMLVIYSIGLKKSRTFFVRLKLSAHFFHEIDLLLGKLHNLFDGGLVLSIELFAKIAKLLSVGLCSHFFLLGDVTSIRCWAEKVKDIFCPFMNLL